MGYAGSADIFQTEMMALMDALEKVRAYIDDLLVITRGTLEDHLVKLGEVLRRLSILVLNPPHNVKELRHFLKLVQSYRDM